MSKQAEINYARALGPAGRRHLLEKPFSDERCPDYLAEIGVIMHLMPPPPARILDIGCGAGWTSRFLARRGYEVTGVDIAGDMIDCAESLRRAEGLPTVRFLVHDYEGLPFDGEFDVALFFDSLHHAVEEEQAVNSAYRALTIGGLCITSEPGYGHSRSAEARAAVTRFGVTERDMTPRRITAMGRKAGFHSCRVFPHAFSLTGAVYRFPGGRWLGGAPNFIKLVSLVSRRLLQLDGIVCMTK